MSVTVVEVNDQVVEVLTDPLSIEEAVQNGITLLDEHFGTNFHEKIDPDQLDIGSGMSCVCGQLYGSYCAGIKKLGVEGTGEEYGFYSRAISKYGELTKAWKDALLARSA